MPRRGNYIEPLELRPGETDHFWFVFGGERGLLATGDTLTGTPTVTSSGVTVTNVAKNTLDLELAGVTYGANEVVLCDLSAIALGNLAEVECTFSTTSGRGPLKVSLFVRGVQNYSD